MIICKNRIKPLLLRDVKTEALLVFVRTTLEDYFRQIENKSNYFELGSKEDNQFIYNELKKLLEKLQDTVINSSYLRSLIENAPKHPSLKVLAKREEPLMVYYDSLVKTIERLLTNGNSWIPELIVIALLSEWIIEEEKTAYFYPYLKDINYLDLITKYENSKKSLNDEKKEVLMNMYKISSKLIDKLKKAEYRINTNRKKQRKRIS